MTVYKRVEWQWVVLSPRLPLLLPLPTPGLLHREFLFNVTKRYREWRVSVCFSIPPDTGAKDPKVKNME